MDFICCPKPKSPYLTHFGYIWVTLGYFNQTQSRAQWLPRMCTLIRGPEQMGWGHSLFCFKTYPVALARQKNRPLLDLPKAELWVAERCWDIALTASRVSSYFPLVSGLCLCHWLKRELTTWTLGRDIPKAPVQVAQGVWSGRNPFEGEKGLKKHRTDSSDNLLPLLPRR